ncbi:MAG: DUF362 domain-containing protein [bacterium]
MKPTVRLINQPSYEIESIHSQVRQALEELAPSVKDRSVFVKPSFVYPARPPLNQGVNTQPAVVGGVARALKDLGARKVWVGEDCLVGPSQCGFAAMGVMPYLKGVAEPVYLQDEDRVEVKVDNAQIEDTFYLPKKLMDADLFISLPKLKVNMYAKVTLSVKNHVGLLLGQDRLSNHHYNIHKKIADLYRARVPDFIVTDAVMAGEGQGPMHAEPSPLGVLVAGDNGPAVDTVCCRLMGFEPSEVPHLVYVHEQGLGPIELSEIEVQGKNLLEERSRRLLRPHTGFEGYHRSIRFLVGHELACPEGCLGMVRGTLDRWAQVHRWKPIKGCAFIIGKPVQDIPPGLSKRKTFVIGDCAKEHSHLGTFIPGCPIPPMALTYALAKKGISGPLATRLTDLARGFLAAKLGSSI